MPKKNVNQVSMLQISGECLTNKSVCLININDMQLILPWVYLYCRKISNTYEYETLCVVWYHLNNFKNVKNTHGGVLFSVKLQTEACNFTKSNTTPWVFFTFLKLCKWYQIAQTINTSVTSMDVFLMSLLIILNRYLTGMIIF